jgi:hypothetical protein
MKIRLIVKTDQLGNRRWVVEQREWVLFVPIWVYVTSSDDAEKAKDAYLQLIGTGSLQDKTVIWKGNLPKQLDR